jgi:hypothetical protein
MKIRKQSGHTLGEYAFISVLVLCVCFLPLKLLSSDIKNTFDAMLVSITTKASHSSPSSSNLGVSSNANQFVSLHGTILPKMIPVKIDQATVMTLGVNGTTLAYVHQLKATADLLKEQGKIDPATYKDIIDLANEGHSIASIEGIIEYQAQAANSNSFVNQTLTINGQQQTIEGLAKSIGINNEGTDKVVNGKTLANFIALRNQVMQDLQGKPNISSIIAPQVEDISIIAQSVQNIVHKIAVNEDNASAFVGSVASAASNKSSGVVCGAGSFSDSGSLCK